MANLWYYRTLDNTPAIRRTLVGAEDESLQRLRQDRRFDRTEPDGVCSPFALSRPGMSKSSQSQQPQSFEAALAELEKIVAAMEAGQLPLEQSIAAYKRGAQLLLYCQSLLKEANQQVKLLDAGLLKDFSIDGQSAVADGSD